MKLSLKLNSSWQSRRAPGERGLWRPHAIVIRPRSAAAYEWTVEIFWKRLLAFGAVLTIGLYLAVATALYFWWARQPGNQVNWTDTVLAPVRWQALRAKRGDTTIAAALESLRTKDYVEAYYGLRVGLARSPGNVRGRLALAKLMLAADPAGATKTLEDGLAYSADSTDLLRALYDLYSAAGAQRRAAEISERLLARQPPLAAEARRQVVADWAASFLTKRNAADALRVLEKYAAAPEDAQAPVIQRMRLHALTVAGRFDEARAALRALPVVNATDRRVVAELAIATGDADSLESILRQMRAENAESPLAYLYAFRCWQKMGRASYRDAAEEDYLRTFGGNDGALQLLAAAAVELDLPATVVRAQSVAVAHRLNPFAFQLHMVEVMLRHGDFDTAFRRMREIEATVATLPPAQRYYPEFIQRLVRACVAGGETQTPALLSLLSDLRARARPLMYQLAIDSLRRAGYREGALQLCTQGLRFYPTTDALLARQSELAAEIQTQQAADTAKRTAENHAAETPIPATAEAALAAIDSALAKEQYSGARDLLRAIRTTAPAWHASAENSLARRDVELALATQDSLTARAVTHAYLQRARPAADLARLAEIARAFAALGRTAEVRWMKAEFESAGITGAPAQIVRALKLPDDLATTLATAEALLAAVDGKLRAGEPDEALRLLDEARKRESAWLAGARNDLLGREVRARYAADQRPLALASFKELVVRPGAPRSLAFKLTRDYWADGEAERARELAREVLRLLPGDKAAAGLLREVEAPPAGKP